MQRRHSTALLLAVAFFSLGAAAAAQQRAAFSGHLSPLPANARESLTMQGRGRVSGSLDGRTLTIKASFEGLGYAATRAAIRRAVPGLRGPVQFSIPVMKSTSGSIETTITLTPAQIEDLTRGWYYLQIDTEKNPEGQLRGWLLQ